MIEMFGAYIKTIVVLLIFAAFAEMIMPDSSLKKYISILVGFLMIITILNPILGIVKGFELDIPEFFNQTDNTLSYDFKKEMESNPKGQNQMVSEIYNQNIASNIKKSLEKEGMKVSYLQVKTNEDNNSEDYGSILSVSVGMNENGEESGFVKMEPVKVYGEENIPTTKEDGEQEQSQEKEKASNLIEKIYGIEKENIIIEIQR